MSFKRLFQAIALVVPGMVSASAGTLTVVFDAPNQSGSPGQTISFYGTIYNTGPDDIYANSADVNLTALTPSLWTFEDLFAFPFLSAGGNTGSIELFRYVIGDPFPDPLTTYYGTYSLSGGIDIDSALVLTDPAAGFSITVEPATAVPEPSTFALMVCSFIAMGVSMKLRGMASRRSDGAS